MFFVRVHDRSHCNVTTIFTCRLSDHDQQNVDKKHREKGEVGRKADDESWIEEKEGEAEIKKGGIADEMKARFFSSA